MKATTKRNLIFTLAILVLAGGLFLAQRLVLLSADPGPSGPVAVLVYSDELYKQTFDLSQDGIYDVDTGTYTIHLEVKDGTIAFVNSPCPDHLCEGFGQLKALGDWAACLPALASLTIEEAEP